MVWPGEIERILTVFVVGASRTLPLSWMVPAMGGPTLPVPIRVGLGLALAVLCFPLIAMHPVPDGVVSWTLLLSREVVVGLVMGLVIACLFRAVEAAGRLTDVLRGANLVEILSPLSDARSTPLGGLFLLLAVVVFWEIGGAGYLVAALARSYEAIPPTLDAVVLQRKAVFVVIEASAKLIESAVALVEIGRAHV